MLLIVMEGKINPRIVVTVHIALLIISQNCNENCFNLQVMPLFFKKKTL